ncbi:MAG: hypothetical protein IT352_17155 [Gemmatimonadales bacterium]|nr:hypothetical protein [Gemmatimonadales bacterium]
MAVTPLGIGRPPLYALTYDAVNEGVFGRADGLQCPHFEASTGSCGIWLHRNAVCSTWFCRHNRGIAGQEMWSDINRLLRIVERSLSIWAAERLGLASSGLRQALLMAEAGNAQVLMLELGGDWPAVGRRCWAGWHRPVADFFVEADKLVAPLEWTQVRHICGSDLSAHVAVCRDSVTTLDSEVKLPPIVRTAPQLGIQYGRTLTTRNALDGLRLSVPMIQALEVASNGCPIADVLACGVTEREIRELLDWRALVEGG